jgi:hypothetical protein
MAFPDKVVRDVWNIHNGRCGCFDTTHGHLGICYKPLIWENRGKEGEGAWEAHHIRSDGPDTHTNCEILCLECYELAKESLPSNTCISGVNNKYPESLKSLV